jgi:hypothetical protein
VSVSCFRNETQYQLNFFTDNQCASLLSSLYGTPQPASQVCQAVPTTDAFASFNFTQYFQSYKVECKASKDGAASALQAGAFTLIATIAAILMLSA